RIRNKFKTLGLVKTFGRLDQSEIPLVNQVAQSEALVLVLLGNGNDKTKVRLCQALQSSLVALPYFLGEDDLFFGCNQVYFTNLVQVFVQRLRLAIGNGLCNFELSHLIC